MVCFLKINQIKKTNTWICPLQASYFKEGKLFVFKYLVAFLGAQMVKNLPAIWDTWVQSLGWDDPLEKEIAAHSSILPGQSPWKEEPGGLQSMEFQRGGHDWVPERAAYFYFLILSFIYLAVPGLSWDVQTLRCGTWDLVCSPGIKPGPSALGAWSLSHWTTREVPKGRN